MAEPPDLEDLARRYLDLWQQQMTQAAADPELAETIRRLFGPWWGAAAAGFPAQETSSATSGTAPARAPSRDRGDQLDDLARRLADVEKRLAAVESAARSRGGKAPARPRRAKA
jgi:hypothetical protein